MKGDYKTKNILRCVMANSSRDCLEADRVMLLCFSCDAKYLEENGKKMTNLTYKRGNEGVQSGRVKELLEDMDDVSSTSEGYCLDINFDLEETAITKQELQTIQTIVSQYTESNYSTGKLYKVIADKHNIKDTQLHGVII